MMRKSSLLALSFAFLFGCDPGTVMTSGGSGGSGGGSGGAGGGSGGSGGGSGGSGGSTGQTLQGTIGSNQSLSGEWTLADNATVATGVTLTFNAGALLHAAPGKSLTVQGTLAVSGTAASAVVFQGQAHAAPGEWGGLVVSAGGTLNASYLTIHNASMPLTTAGNSHFTIDHLTVDTSTNFARLASDGTITHSVFHGIDTQTPGGPFQIMNASPQLTDVLIDHGNTGVADLVIVGGAASGPVFDHVEVAQSHCAFHFNQGTNVTVKNSYIHNNSYAFMIEASSTIVQNTNMINNGINIGDCFGGSANVSGSYAMGNMFDGSCNGQTNTSPANGPLTGVGPRP